MHTRSAITKMHTLFIINLVIVSFASGGYFYIQANKLVNLTQDQIELSDLQIEPNQSRSGVPIKVSVNAKNIVDQNGLFLVILKIDNVPRQNETVTLLRSESKKLEFIIVENEVGEHSLKIGELSGSFTITEAFQLSELSVDRSVVGVNDPIKISFKVINIKDEEIEYTAVLFVNGSTRETKNIRLAQKESQIVEFEVSEELEGIYSFRIGNLSGTYEVTAKAPLLNPDQIQLSDFSVNPQAVTPGESVRISVKIKSNSDSEGSYALSLKINGVERQTQTIQLSPRGERIVEFMTTEKEEGSYLVDFNGLSSSFIVQTAVPPPDSVIFSNLYTNPLEAWPNYPVNASVNVKNEGNEVVSFTLPFKVNDVVNDKKNIRLSSGEEKTIIGLVQAPAEGSWNVSAGTKSVTLNVVPEGKHTLIVRTYPDGIEITIDGVKHTTPYRDLVDVGVYTIIVPATVTLPWGSRTGTFNFLSWPDGSKELTKQVTVEKFTLVSPEYLTLSSCPSLFVWNGSDYEYRTEVSAGTGYLGILDYFREDYSMAFLYSDPWDYSKIDKNHIATKNGYYDIELAQMWDELFYIDSVKLIAVDHPVDLDVFSTQSTYLYELSENGKIYTVSKQLKTPVSAFNSEGQNILSHILKQDGFDTPSYGDFNNEFYEIDLGQLKNAEQIKLVVSGKILYSRGEVQGEWAAQFAQRPGEKPFPPPYMEVKALDGSWLKVPDNRQFPLLDVNDDTFVIDMTGLFPTDNFTIRIHTFFDTRIDFIGVDITQQKDIIVHELNPLTARLYKAFSTSSSSLGNFTRYGDVTCLVVDPDDMFVIGRQGDTVNVQFSSDLPPIPEGMERDFFVFTKCWFKVNGLPFLDFSVEPLPFTEMSAFPYPPTEFYPNTAEYINYQKYYNTRTIQP